MRTSLQWCFHINLFCRCIFLYFSLLFLANNKLSVDEIKLLLISADVLYIFLFSGTRWHENVIQTTETDILFIFFFFSLLFVFQSNNNIINNNNNNNNRKKVFHNFYFTLLPTNVHSFRNNFTQAAFHKVCSQK